MGCWAFHSDLANPNILPSLFCWMVLVMCSLVMYGIWALSFLLTSPWPRCVTGSCKVPLFSIQMSILHHKGDACDWPDRIDNFAMWKLKEVLIQVRRKFAILIVANRPLDGKESRGSLRPLSKYIRLLNWYHGNRPMSSPDSTISIVILTSLFTQLPHLWLKCLHGLGKLKALIK